MTLIESSRAKVRKQHSKMEYDASASYSIMAKSNEYLNIYSIYIEFFKNMYSNTNKRILRILNLGMASGIVENLLLTEFGRRMHIVSIDNSQDFLDLATELNKEYINKQLVEFHFVDIENDSLEFGKFDVILSRDFNHHILNLSGYFEKCFSSLNEVGIMLMEDLRFDASFEAIHKFCDLVFSIKEFRNDRWNLLNKINGMIESFMSSYTDKEIEIILKNYQVKWRKHISKSRYHYCIFKNEQVFKKSSKQILSFLK